MGLVVWVAVPPTDPFGKRHWRVGPWGRSCTVHQLSFLHEQVLPLALSGSLRAGCIHSHLPMKPTLRTCSFQIRLSFSELDKQRWLASTSQHIIRLRCLANRGGSSCRPSKGSGVGASSPKEACAPSGPLAPGRKRPSDFLPRVNRRTPGRRNNMHHVWCVPYTFRKKDPDYGSSC